MAARKKPLTPAQEAAARRFVAEQDARVLAEFTPEGFCTTKSGVVFEQQLAFVRAMLDPAVERILASSTPRAGKTRPVLYAFARAALDTPDTNYLYIAITRQQARGTAWKFFRRMVKDHKLPIECSNDAEMVATCSNGSTIYFAAVDTIEAAYVWLGFSFAGGIVCVDEVANRSDAVIEPILETIEDRLTDTTPEHPHPGKLVLISQLPRNPGGYFYRQVTDLTQPWTRFRWSRLENPFLTDQQARLQKELQSKNLSIDDEHIRRVFYAEPVWTKNGGRPYRYDEQRNGYTPVRPAWVDAVVVRSGQIFAAEPWPGIDAAICAIDLGGADRASIQAIGYGRSVEAVQHLFDWTSERDQHYTWGELLQILAVVRQHYHVVRWVYDSDASRTEHDTLGREHGIPLIAAAHKTEMVAQIRRLSDLLQRGKVKVILGSKTAEDFARAQWDQRELARGRWKLAIGAAKVDASEAFRYAVGEWWSTYRTPAAKVDAAEAARRREQKELDDLFRPTPKRPGHHDATLDRYVGQLTPGSAGWRDGY